jgi:hypothetical protein
MHEYRLHIEILGRLVHWILFITPTYMERTNYQRSCSILVDSNSGTLLTLYSKLTYTVLIQIVDINPGHNVAFAFQNISYGPLCSSYLCST